MNWEEAIKELDNKLFGSVDLMCDGYNVTFEKRMWGTNQLRICFFIDGEWAGSYAMADS